MFLLEAIPTIVLGLVVLGFLPDRPSDATWLTTQEKDWLARELASECAPTRHDHTQQLCGRR